MGSVAPEGFPHVSALAGGWSDLRFYKLLTSTRLTVHKKAHCRPNVLWRNALPPSKGTGSFPDSRMLLAAFRVSDLFLKKARSLLPFIFRLCKAGRDQKLVGATPSPM